MDSKDKGDSKDQGSHRMGWRGHAKNYYWAGTYHITIKVNEALGPLLGAVVGDVTKSDDDPQAPRVSLSDIGAMVEQELTTAITAHYPMVEVQDHVVMPDHLHAIFVVHRNIVSSNGRLTHLGQVIAGFKKGCNRRFWQLRGFAAPAGTGAAERRGEPASASPPGGAPLSAGGAPLPAGGGPLSAAGGPPLSGGGGPPLAVLPQEPLPQGPLPQGRRPSSRASTGRPSLFSDGYVDVQPLREGQLEQQRRYIRNNPRSRLLRSTDRQRLHTQRGGIDTAVSLPALRGFLQRECRPSQFTDERWLFLCQRLLTATREKTFIICDSYGDRQLLQRRLLPVVCHRRDAWRFEEQKQRCLEAAAAGVVLVSGRIAKGEQAIIDTALSRGFPVVLIADNGFPEVYHPSERRLLLCSEGRLLLVTPWRYRYRRAEEEISVAECKTMNCVAQALCRTRDDWWK